MTSAAPARYTFDLDLGGRQRAGRAMSDTALETVLAAARAEGHAEGLAAAQRTATGALAAAADSLAASAAAMAGALDEAQKQALAGAVVLATAVAHKLAGALITRQPIAELEALIAECLASIESAPHLVVRCHTDLADTVRAVAEERIATTGFAGRLVVIGDPEIALGDGRIEWADGGIVRDSATLAAEIDARIKIYLDARGIALPQETLP